MSPRRSVPERAASKAARAAFFASRTTNPDGDHPSSASAPDIATSALDTTAE